MTEPEDESDETAPAPSIGSLVRARTALQWIDLAFLVCAATTIVLWSAGITVWQLVVVFCAWCVVWVLWMADRPLTV